MGSHRARVAGHATRGAGRRAGLSFAARAGREEAGREGPEPEGGHPDLRQASTQHGREIAEVFPAPQVDLYGSTEAGYLFVGEAFKDNSQVIDANAFIELVPWRAELPDVFQIYVTTRDREAMPLLRYHTGDIVQKFPTGFRLLGREGNLYFRADGSLVSPTDIDAALPADFRCWHYSLVQTGETRWDFHYVADHAPDHRAIETALAQLIGGGARVNAFRRRFIAPAASGKFALLKPLGR
jgi:phenylacetate-CoA ligase